MTAQEWLARLVSDQEYRLKQATDAWDRCVAKIRDNPNQLNVHGIWLDADENIYLAQFDRAVSKLSRV